MNATESKSIPIYALGLGFYFTQVNIQCSKEFDLNRKIITLIHTHICFLIVLSKERFKEAHPLEISLFT
jgi:hypothetical protein